MVEEEEEEEVHDFVRKGGTGGQSVLLFLILSGNNVRKMPANGFSPIQYQKRLVFTG